VERRAIVQGPGTSDQERGFEIERDTDRAPKGPRYVPS
jgi:hypothetical protein